jgi:hypothetical protein
MSNDTQERERRVASERASKQASDGIDGFFFLHESRHETPWYDRIRTRDISVYMNEE